jgi:hypothetical protein
MMASLFHEWPTAPFRNDSKGPQTHNDETDESPPLPRGIHVGLSIDSDSSHRERMEDNDAGSMSELSDLEEGMPLWIIVKPPRHLLLPHQDESSAENKLSMSLDARTSLTHRSRPNCPHSLSFPLLSKEDSHTQRLIPPDWNSLDNSTIQRRRPWKYIITMAISMVVVAYSQSYHQESSFQSLRSEFPTFSQTTQLQLPTVMSSSLQTPIQRRSNIALARSQEERPVFGLTLEETFEQKNYLWISWLGGCAFCLILLETGYKVYNVARRQKLHQLQL